MNERSAIHGFVSFAYFVVPSGASTRLPARQDVRQDCLS